MTPGSIERVARIADGLNPIAISRDQLEALVTAYGGAARAAGHDPASLMIVVRANTTISPEPLPGAGRPVLGGSAEQIARDLDYLRSLHVDQVFIGSGYASSVDDEVRLLEQATAGASAPSTSVTGCLTRYHQRTMVSHLYQRSMKATCRF